jgi:hypothetical protein
MYILRYFDEFVRTISPKEIVPVPLPALPAHETLKVADRVASPSCVENVK